jgi:hypothetical protein
MESIETHAPLETFTQHPPIVAVFDTNYMALRTVAELQTAEFDDIWLAVVRGETDDGETTVSCDGAPEVVLSRALIERGTIPEEASDFDGILPPGTAVMSLRVRGGFDQAIRIVEVTGGHIQHL